MNKFRAYLTRCLNAQYEITEESGDYAIQREGDILYLCFQWSNGKEDWKNNTALLNEIGYNRYDIED